MAPQAVCPSTKISRVFSAPVQNSRLPSTLPSACVQGVASVAQHKEVPRKGIKDGFQGHARIRTEKQSSVGSLAHVVQICAHALVDFASCGGTHCKALVAILQHGQGILWHHWLALGGSDRGALDGWRHGALGGQQLGLLSWSGIRSSGHALRVPQHQDQLGAQLASAELQAANDAPFCLMLTSETTSCPV